MTEYTAQEIAQHNAPGSYWIILHGKVYDVTSYLDDHPGGKDVLVDSAGSDATEDFDFTGHSKTAKEALKGYLVGSLAGYTEKKKRSPLAALFPNKLTADQRKSTLLRNSSMPKVYLGLVLLVASLTYALRYVKRPIFDGSGFWTGVLATFAVVGSTGWYGLYWARNAFFPTEDVFTYPPYY